MPPPPRLALGYCRVSTTRQERWSLPAQRKALEEHARRQGWRYELHEETGSGESIAGRPVFRGLLERIAAGSVGVLLVIEFERLCRARDLAELAAIKGICRAAGCSIATPAQTLDLSDAEDDFLHSLFGILATREKQKMLARQKRGIAEARAAGRWHGGRAPAGYAFDAATRSLVADDVAAGKVRDLLHAALTCGVNRLRQLHPQWSPGMIRRAISRQRLLGYAGQIELPDGRLVPAAWPALIPLELALRVDAARSRRSQIRWGAAGQKKRLLTGLGLFRCGHCGLLMRSADRSPGKRGPNRTYLYYFCDGGSRRKLEHVVRCPNAASLPVAPIDAAVLRLIWRALPGELDAAAAHDAEVPSKPSPEHVLLSQLESAKGRLVAAIEAGVLSLEDARDRVADLTSRMASTRARIAQDRVSPLTVPEGLRESLTRLPEAIPVTAARELLLAVCRRIELHERGRLALTLWSGKVVLGRVRA